MSSRFGRFRRRRARLVCALALLLAAAQPIGAACAQPSAARPGQARTLDVELELLAAPAQPRPTEPRTQAPPPGQSPSEQAAEAHTGIRGRVRDGRSGRGIEFATVLATDARGMRSTTSVARGDFALELPPGSYEVRAYADMYQPALLANVQVEPGRYTQLQLLIEARADAAVEEVDIPYRAAAQRAAPMAEQPIVVNAGRDDASAPAPAAAPSAVNDYAVRAAIRGPGMFIGPMTENPVIRGLGVRYGRVLLNGDPLPSIDPDRPALNLELLPASLLVSVTTVTTTKLPLPPMPGDFASGMLELNTVAFPRHFTLKVRLSAEYSSRTSWRKYLSYRGGRYDLLGFDDGARALPAGIDGVRVQISPSGSFRSPADLEAVAGMFPNRWNYRGLTAPPSPALGVVLGDSLELPGGKRLGYLASASYDYRVRRLIGYSRKLGVDDTGRAYVADNYPTVEVGAEAVQLSGVGMAALDLGPGHKLRLLSLYNRSGDDQTSLRVGQNTSVNSDAMIESWQLRYVGRSLWFNQLRGDHNLFGSALRLRWGGYYGSITRDEPDRRNIKYVQNASPPYEQSWRSGDATRYYSNLTGRDYGGSLSLQVPLWKAASSTLGGAVRVVERSFWTRTFQFVRSDSGQSEAAYEQQPELLFSRQGLGTITRLAPEQTRASDSFNAAQTTFAGFLMLETPLIGDLSLTAGARTEVYRQRMAPNSPFGSSDPSADLNATFEPANRTDINLLPAVALAYELSAGMQLKAAYGETVNRPQPRELAPYMYYDFLRDRSVVGNLELRTTLVQHAELRWQWGLGRAQLASASLFYERFRRPIERQIISSDGTSVFENSPSALGYGAEIELHSSLEQLHRALRLFELSADLTLLYSRVGRATGLFAADGAGPRRMFGQAPYVINLTLRFAEPVTKFSTSLAYHVVGPRILDVGMRVGTQGLPDAQEQPFHALDLTANWQATANLSLKLNWTNMLLRSRRVQQGSVYTLRIYPGTFVSLSMDLTY